MQAERADYEYFKKHNKQNTTSEIDKRDSDGNSPLCLAVMDGDPNIVTYLIGKGADKNISDGNGRSLILVSVVEYLLEIEEERKADRLKIIQLLYS